MSSSSQLSSICVRCKYQPSVISCEGCQQKFCYTCFHKHYDELSLDFDDLINRRNELVEIMKTSMPLNVNDQSTYFEQINQWENEMYANIDRVATKAREIIRQRLTEANQNVQTELNRLSDELQHRQKANRYMETDLNRIKQQLTELTDTVQKFKDNIRIDTTVSKTIPWDTLLSIKLINNTSPIISSRPTNHSYSQQMTTCKPVQNRSASPPPPYDYVNPSSASRNTHRSSLQTASVHRNSRSTSFTCIGCKTTNDFYENRRNICFVCKQPANF